MVNCETDKMVDYEMRLWDGRRWHGWLWNGWLVDGRVWDGWDDKFVNFVRASAQAMINNIPFSKSIIYQSTISYPPSHLPSHPPPCHPSKTWNYPISHAKLKISNESRKLQKYCKMRPKMWMVFDDGKLMVDETDEMIKCEKYILPSHK